MMGPDRTGGKSEVLSTLSVARLKAHNAALPVRKNQSRRLVMALTRPYSPARWCSARSGEKDATRKLAPLMAGG